MPPKAPRYVTDAPMTVKMRRFVDEYMLDLHAGRAAERAGYKSPSKKGPDLLMDSRVQAALSAAQKRLADRTQIKVDDIAEELRRIVFADIRNIVTVDEDGAKCRQSEKWTDAEASAVAAVSQTQHGVRITMHDKNAAADKLLRMLGAYDDRLKVESTGPAPVVNVVFGADDPPA